MTRFEQRFVEELAKFSEEHGFVITDGGKIEPIQDWISPGGHVEYEIEERNGELFIIDPYEA